MFCSSKECMKFRCVSIKLFSSHSPFSLCFQHTVTNKLIYVYLMAFMCQLEQQFVDVEAKLQLREQDVHDHIVGTISFSAFEAADLDRVWAKFPFCITSCSHHIYYFQYIRPLKFLFEKIATQIHISGRWFFQTKFRMHLFWLLGWRVAFLDKEPPYPAFELGPILYFV